MNKKIVRIIICIAVITTCAFVIYLENISPYNPSMNHTDYWGNYFSVLGTVVAILGSVVLFIENEKKEKIKESAKEAKEKIEKIDVSKIKILFPIISKLEKSEPLIDEDIIDILTLILEVDALTRLMENEEDVSDPLNDSPVVTNIISSNSFHSYSQFINDNYPELSTRLDSYKNMHINEENTELLKKSILGDWIISQKNAKKAKLIIGISGYNNQILGIYKLPQYDNEKNSFSTNADNGRVRFFVGNDRKYSHMETTILKSWTSRNPVLYPNHFENYGKEVQEYLSNTDLKALDGLQDIIIVKTFVIKSYETN